MWIKKWIGKLNSYTDKKMARIYQNIVFHVTDDWPSQEAIAKFLKDLRKPPEINCESSDITAKRYWGGLNQKGHDKDEQAATYSIDGFLEELRKVPEQVISEDLKWLVYCKEHNIDHWKLHVDPYRDWFG